MSFHSQGVCRVIVFLWPLLAGISFRNEARPSPHTMGLLTVQLGLDLEPSSRWKNQSRLGAVCRWRVHVGQAFLVHHVPPCLRQPGSLDINFKNAYPPEPGHRRL